MWELISRSFEPLGGLYGLTRYLGQGTSLVSEPTVVWISLWEIVALRCSADLGGRELDDNPSSSKYAVPIDPWDNCSLKEQLPEVPYDLSHLHHASSVLYRILWSCFTKNWSLSAICPLWLSHIFGVHITFVFQCCFLTYVRIYTLMYLTQGPC